MKFKLEIELGNDALPYLDGEDNLRYETREELARMLQDVASQLQRGRDAKPLFDANGNRVGEYYVSV